MCVAAVFGGMVVTFSWWGVNLLGIGLHSYGFISGIRNTLAIVYTIEAAVIAVGLVASRVPIGSVVPAKSRTRNRAPRGRIPRVKHQS